MQQLDSDLLCSIFWSGSEWDNTEGTITEVFDFQVLFFGEDLKVLKFDLIFFFLI